jgi:hypothetical protein
VIDALREAVAHRVADSDLARTAQHLDVPEPAPDLVGQVGGAVRTVVVDDEDVGVGRGGPRAFEELRDVLRFLVGRSHDEGPHRLGNLPSNHRSDVRLDRRTSRCRWVASRLKVALAARRDTRLAAVRRSVLRPSFVGALASAGHPVGSGLSRGPVAALSAQSARRG